MNIKVHETILKMSHAYFKDRKATPKEVRMFIVRAKDFYSEEVIDGKWLFQKLKAIHLSP